MFLRATVAWDGDRDLLELGAVLALIIAALTFFPLLKGKERLTHRRYAVD